MAEVVARGGENWLEISLIPNRKGMLIAVKTHPLVEEFMQSLGEGRIISLSELGGTWMPAEESRPLTAYNADQLERTLRGAGYRSVNIRDIGANLVAEDDSINLSFLRLAGITEGVKFISTKEVYPLWYRRELKVRIGNAFRDFVREYIQPVKITLVMSSQET